MAGRRSQPPTTVQSVSLAATGDAPTDRVMKQAEAAIADLQRRIGALEARVTALGG